MPKSPPQTEQKPHFAGEEIKRLVQFMDVLTEIDISNSRIT